MPQTEEHLSILELLRVTAGVVALTKCDLVDDEWLELVRDEIRARLKSSTMRGAPIVACSALTGAGLPELRAALDDALSQAPVRRDVGRPRLPVDRVFTITGFGTVVTGTLQDGQLRVGLEAQLAPSGRRVRIRGMQAHKRAVDVALPGGRVAVNLTGVAKSEVQRGDVLTLPGAMQPTTALDVRLEALLPVGRPITHNMLVELYVAAAVTPARVLLLDADEIAPGESGWAQLRLARPIAAARGDRFIVRVPSPSATIGGGLVLDAYARRHRRHDAKILARLDVLARGDPEQLIVSLLQPARESSAKTRGGFGGRQQGEIAEALGLDEDETRAALDALTQRGAVVTTGGRAFAREHWERLTEESRRILEQYHRQFPLRAGMPKEEWRSRVGLAPREALDTLPALTLQGTLSETAGGAGTPRGGLLRLPNHEPSLSPAQEAAVAALLDRLRAQPFTPPSREEMEDELGAEVVGALIDRGTLVRVGETILLERAAYHEARRRIVHYLREHEHITVAEGRDLLGATRKYMLAIFEHLDERHVTRRIGDDRVLGTAANDMSEVDASDGFAESR